MRDEEEIKNALQLFTKLRDDLKGKNHPEKARRYFHYIKMLRWVLKMPNSWGSPIYEIERFEFK